MVVNLKLLRIKRMPKDFQYQYPCKLCGQMPVDYWLVCWECWENIQNAPTVEMGLMNYGEGALNIDCVPYTGKI